MFSKERKDNSNPIIYKPATPLQPSQQDNLSGSDSENRINRLLARKKANLSHSILREAFSPTNDTSQNNVMNLDNKDEGKDMIDSHEIFGVYFC